MIYANTKTQNDKPKQMHKNEYYTWTDMQI